ncbi:MAG: hypothetical protein AABY22_28560 [Nanoarchaeota archaeon]
MSNNPLMTTIKLKKTTVEKLKKLGKKGDTYEDLIQKLIFKSKD